MRAVRSRYKLQGQGHTHETFSLHVGGDMVQSAFKFLTVMEAMFGFTQGKIKLKLSPNRQFQ